MRYPFITAHSGCMNTPMNSLEYFYTALNFGADIIEFDVNITKDKVAVLFHDEEILIEGTKRNIKDIDYQSLKEVKKDLLRLEEIFQLREAKDVIFNIDLKNCEEHDIVLKILSSMKMEDKVFITGCGSKTAYQIKLKNPRVQVLMNEEKEQERDVYSLCNKAVENYCCGINVEYKKCNKELVDYAHKRGIMVFVWTVDEINAMEKIIDLKVDSITTNELKKLKDYLSKVCEK